MLACLAAVRIEAAGSLLLLGYVLAALVATLALRTVLKRAFAMERSAD